jgi:hypothetical protein
VICISRITPCGTPYLSGSAGWRASRCDSHRRWPAGAGRLPPSPFLSDMPAPAPRFFCECPVDCVAGAPSFFHMEKARLVPKFTAHRPGDLRPVILPGWRRSGIVRRIVGVCACARSYVPGTLPPPAGCPMTRWQRDVPPLQWMACHLSECRHRGRKALHGCGKLAGAISRASCSCLHFINHDVRAGGKNRHDPERGVLTPDKGRRISRPSTTAAALPDGRTVRPQIFLVRALMLSGVGLIDLAL